MSAGGVTRLRLDLAYDGSGFHGWAAQPGLRTVQGVLEHWITTVLRLDAPAAVTCAGRTDAGVHARGQVAHVDLPAAVDGDVAEVLARRLRRVLPEDVVVRAVRPAPPGFDARFAAIWRRYVYRLDDSAAPDPLLRSMIVRSVPLDVAAMHAAAQQLVGLRDFAPFCKRREGATTIRTLLEVRCERSGDAARGVVACTIRADAFCHSMVRSLMGALTEVGSGRRDAAWLAGVAAQSSRANDVPVLPAHGLCLEEVAYPDDAALAARVAEARARRDGGPA